MENDSKKDLKDTIKTCRDIKKDVKECQDLCSHMIETLERYLKNNKNVENNIK